MLKSHPTPDEHIHKRLSSLLQEQHSKQLAELVPTLNQALVTNDPGLDQQMTTYALLVSKISRVDPQHLNKNFPQLDPHQKALLQQKYSHAKLQLSHPSQPQPSVNMVSSYNNSNFQQKMDHIKTSYAQLIHLQTPRYNKSAVQNP